MLDYQAELLREVKHKYSLSKEVCQAYQALPRHKFLTKFSPDNVSWLSATPENLPFIYGDNSLLLYQRQGQIATISQPSFALRMLDLLDLKPQLRAFEVGTGSGWNAALMGYLVGRRGQIKSWEIIPTVFQQAKVHLEKFDLPQVEIFQGDGLLEIWEEKEFDRGIFTAGAWDMPGILFDVIKDAGKLLFVLKTTRGDLVLAMEKSSDHFRVYEKVPCKFVALSGPSLGVYYNDLSEIYRTKGEITIWPQGTMGLGANVVIGRDMIFKIE